MATSPPGFPPGAVPLPRTRLIGREGERVAAKTALLEDVAALLTLTGPGGVGKTRLALAIAGEVVDSFADGVAWVDLAPLGDPALVSTTIAAALGFIPTPDRPVAEELGRHLRMRQILLLLDNCERVLTEAAAVIVHLLTTCPALQILLILATSRAPLRVRAEWVFPVEPLPLPTSDVPSREAMHQNPAVRLFLDRARAVFPALTLNPLNAPTVAAVCLHLDGLPLAIELVAARVNVLSPEELLFRLERRLPLPTARSRDLPARHRTMGDAIAWSSDLLSPSAQALFRRLAVLVGRFNLEAAEAIGGSRGESNEDVVSDLTALIDHSLVRRVDSAGDGNGPRYSILETIRECALEKLIAAGEESETRTHHADYFLDLIDALDAAVAPHLPDASRVLHRLDIEHPNLRAALGWFAATGAAEAFVQLTGALHAFWLHFGYLQEARSCLEHAVAMEDRVSAPARVWALVGLTAVLSKQHEPTRTQTLIEEAVALARGSGDPVCLAVAAQWHGIVDASAGRIDRAERMLHEARAAFASVPPVPWVVRDIAHVETVLGWIALIRGDFATAETRALATLARQRLLEQEHQAPYPYISNSQILLGHLARARGDSGSALSYYQSALRDGASFGEVRNEVEALSGVAGALAALGRWAEAARLFGATERLCEQSGMRFGEHDFNWQRALGLPEPWQQASEPFGAAAALRAAIQERSASPPLPLPEPVTAARLWADGRQLPLNEAIAEALAVNLTRSGHRPGDQGIATPPPIYRFGLSPREREVLALLCQRLTDAEIGEALFISSRTASRHVANLFNKLGVSSRRDAAALATSQGLI